jgi:hypothetical protein
MGKTFTVVESIIQLPHHDPKVKVLTYTLSNAAVNIRVSGHHDAELFCLNAYLRYEEAIPKDVQAFCIILNHARLRCALHLLLGRPTPDIESSCH